MSSEGLCNAERRVRVRSRPKDGRSIVSIDASCRICGAGAGWTEKPHTYFTIMGDPSSSCETVGLRRAKELGLMLESARTFYATRELPGSSKRVYPSGKQQDQLG